jgi:putative peptidoglycan lipid II flippase
MLVYVIISQVGLVVMLNIANRAGDQGAPGPAIFNNAFLIFMMAHGIVAVSIITALMPRMSAAAAERRHRDLADHLSLGIRLAAVVLLPATVFYIVLGRHLGVALFQAGAYTPREALLTGWVIAAAGVGLVPFSISQLQIFAFYAMPDTKTPALLNLPVVALRIALDVAFFLILPVVWVDAGLMGGNAISYLASVVLGYWLLHRRIGRLGLGQVLSTLTRLAAAAAVAAGPTALVAWALGRELGAGKWSSIVILVVCGAVLIVGYVAVAFLLRVREVREVALTIRARLGR